MGGTAANRLSTVVAGSTLGATGGGEKHTLTTAQVPGHTHTQGGSFGSGGHSADHAHYTTTGGISANHYHGYTQPIAASRVQGGNDNYEAYSVGGRDWNTGYVSSDHVHGGWSGGVNTNHSHTISISGETASTGSSNAHDNVQPTIVLNYIIKV
jgi:microcystin-dependent protein